MDFNVIVINVIGFIIRRLCQGFIIMSFPGIIFFATFVV